MISLRSCRSRRRRRRSGSSRGCSSSTMRGGSGWRRNAWTPWSRRPARSPPGPVTCARSPCCASSSRRARGLNSPRATGPRPPTRPSRLADESGDEALRIAIRTAGSYSYMVAGDLEHCEQLVDEALEIAGDDHSAGNGLVIGCPYAWAIMAKGIIRRDRCEFDAGEELFEKALRIAAEQGDPETASWTRGNLAIAAGGAGRPRFGPRARPAKLRAHGATRRRLLEMLGAGQPGIRAAGARGRGGRPRLHRARRPPLPRGDGQGRRGRGLARGADGRGAGRGRQGARGRWRGPSVRSRSFGSEGCSGRFRERSGPSPRRGSPPARRVRASFWTRPRRWRRPPAA